MGRSMARVKTHETPAVPGQRGAVMSFLALHSDAHLTLSTDEGLIPAAQVRSFTDAMALLQALRCLRDGEALRIASAVQTARAQGHAQGLLEGQREAQAEAAEQVADTLAQLVAEQQQQHADMREAVLALSLLLVRRIAATLAPDQVLAALLADALDRVLANDEAGRGAAPCAIRLPPQLLDAVRRHCQARAPALAVEWRADDSLAPLDCVIETAAGRVLAGLDAQLERIRAVLHELPRERAVMPLQRAST
jgi:type III secretion protein L